MKKVIIISVFILTIFSLNFVKAQDAKEEDKPVRSPYETTVLVDFPTTTNVNKGVFELMINHRFGKFGNGFSDLHGIYAPSNIRMVLNYGVTSKLMIGFGTEKNNQMQDFQLKYSILTQTRSGAMPVSLSYYASAVIDAREKGVFGENYVFSHRLSYFNQLIVSRKINHKMTVQTSVSYSHFNSVDSTQSHDKIAWQIGGRYKLWNSNSFIFEYSLPFNDLMKRTEATFEAEPGFSAGIEFGTSTHCFQVFVSNYDHLLRQKIIAYNQNSFFGGDILVGFNITVRF